MRYSLLLAILLGPASAAVGQPYRYEAEDGTLFGTYVANSVPGYSGSGYVTGFNSTLSGGDYFQLNVDVPDGLYEMWVGYRSQYGQKGYTYQVDDSFGSGKFDQTFASDWWQEDRAGLFNVTGGTNTLGIYQNWGYYDIDYLEFRPFTPPTLSPVSPQLVDPQADSRTQLLMNYMTSLYGNKTLSGNQGQVGQNDPFPTQDYLNRSGVKVPAIRNSDFIDYSPSRVERYDNRNNETERVISWAQQTGGVASMMWHWNAPTDLIDQPGNEWWRGFYTNATTFDLPGALADPAGADYQLILRDIDAIGDELEKFQDAGVPVVWRPLHEAQGGWFWWGAHGPDTFKDLWHLMYDRLTNVHGLHNLIWEFTSSAAEGNFLDWYPGDDEVDMIGLDIYTDPSSSMSGQWYDILQEFDGRKMIALSETGTLPDPDDLDAYGINWSYIAPWTWDFVQSQYAGYSSTEITAALQALMGDERIITLDELPAFPWRIALPGDYNNDGTVDAADYTLWRDTMEAGGTTLANDLTPGEVNEFDFQVWRTFFGQSLGGGAGAAAVPEPGSALLMLIAATWLVRRRR